MEAARLRTIVRVEVPAAVGGLRSFGEQVVRVFELSRPLTQDRVLLGVFRMQSPTGQARVYGYYCDLHGRPRPTFENVAWAGPLPTTDQLDVFLMRAYGVALIEDHILDAALLEKLCEDWAR